MLVAYALCLDGRPPPPGMALPPGFVPPQGMLPPGQSPFPSGVPPPMGAPGAPPFIPSVPPPGGQPPLGFSPPPGDAKLQIPITSPPISNTPSLSLAPPSKPSIPNPALKQENPELKKGQVLIYADANYSPVRDGFFGSVKLTDSHTSS